MTLEPMYTFYELKGNKMLVENREYISVSTKVISESFRLLLEKIESLEHEEEMEHSYMVQYEGFECGIAFSTDVFHIYGYYDEKHVFELIDTDKIVIPLGLVDGMPTCIYETYQRIKLIHSLMY